MSDKQAARSYANFEAGCMYPSQTPMTFEQLVTFTYFTMLFAFLAGAKHAREKQST